MRESSPPRCKAHGDHAYAPRPRRHQSLLLRHCTRWLTCSTTLCMPYRYIIQRGLVAKLGRVLGQGRFFGEVRRSAMDTQPALALALAMTLTHAHHTLLWVQDVILRNSRRKYFVRVLTYLDVYALSREDLDAILDVQSSQHLNLLLLALWAAHTHVCCPCPHHLTSAQTGDFDATRRTIRRAAIRLALQREMVRIKEQLRMHQYGASHFPSPCTWEPPPAHSPLSLRCNTG